MRRNRHTWGPYNWFKADTLLQGRCKHSRKVQNNTHLQRRDGGAIALRLHATDVLTWYPDGRVEVRTGGYHTATTKDRINSYLSGYSVYSGGRDFGSDTWGLYKDGGGPICTIGGTLTIMPDGKVKGGGSVEDARKSFRDARNAAARERYKERFWFDKARQGGKLSPAKAKLLTLEAIPAEGNISTRTAMIKVYGLERFLVAIEATTINTYGDYSLLSYTHNPGNQWGQQHIRALKMVCPSTKTVYIHPVDPQCETVSAALDYMFGVPNYLDRLAAES